MAATSASRCSRLSRDAEAKTRPLHNTAKPPTEIRPPIWPFLHDQALLHHMLPAARTEACRVDFYIFFGSNRGRSLRYYSPRRLFSCPFVHPAGLLGVLAFSRSGRLNSPGTTHLDGPISFVYFLLGMGGGVWVGVPTFIFSIILLWLPWCLGFALHYYTFLWRRVCDLFFSGANCGFLLGGGCPCTLSWCW